MATFESKQELDAKRGSAGSFAALEAESYIAKIVNVETGKRKQSHNSKMSRGEVTDISMLPADEVVTEANVELLIYGLKSGDPIVDIEGNNVPALKRRAWKSYNENSVGFNSQGEPSHRRAILAFALKKDVQTNFEGSEDQINGLYVGVDLNVYVNKKGEQRNGVVRFTKVPTSFAPDFAVEAQAMKEYQEAKDKKKDNDGSVNNVVV